MSQFGKISSLFGGGPVQIGIDIGACSVKVVGLKNPKSPQPTLVGMGKAETPLGSVIDGAIQDPRGIAEAIKEAFAQARIRYTGQMASIGLRGIGVIFKRIVMPLQDGEEMSQQVMLEAQQQVDSDLADWIIDYQILTEPDAQGQVSLMLVGARQSVVDEYINVIKSLGILPAIFDCDIFAIENSYQQVTGPGSDTVLCLDVGKDGTRVNLLQDGIPLIVRNLEMGGAMLTEQISKNLAVSIEQAETLKISSSSSDDLVDQPEVTRAIDNYVRELCGEIQNTIEFFTSSTTEVQLDGIDRIVLSGGGAATRGLAEALSRTLSAPVNLATPFQNMQVGRKVAQVNNEHLEFSHLFSVASGLALRYEGDKPN